SKESGIEALRRLIRRRIAIDEWRWTIATVRIDGEELFESSQRVHTIIDLFSNWWFARVERDEDPDLEHAIGRMKSLLQSGEWIDEAMAELRGEVALSAEQMEDVRAYSEGPARFTYLSFAFSNEGFDIRAQLDVFPPEEFLFLVQT